MIKKTAKEILIILTVPLCLLLLFNSISAQKAELVVQTGHSDVVHSVAFSPDGNFLASAGGEDKTIKLWNVDSGQELKTFNGHTLVVFSVAFSPNGKMLASAGLDKTIKLWDVSSGKEIRTINYHVSQPTQVIFSPDGKALVSAGTDRTIKFWNVADGTELKTFSNKFSSQILSIAFDPTGKILATSDRNKSVIFWDVDTEQKLQTLSGHTYDVESIDFSPDGKILASASADKTVKIWDVVGGKELKTLSGHASTVLSVTFNQNGKILASLGRDNTIKIWDVAEGKELRNFESETSRFALLAFSPNKNFLASSGERDKTIKIWDADSGQRIRTLRGHTAEVSSVVFSSDGKTLASVNRNKTIKLWDIADGRELRTLNGHDLFIPAVAFSPEGEILTSVSWDRTIKLWSVVSGKMLESYDLDGQIPKEQMLEEFAGFYERNYRQPLKVYPVPLSEKFVAQRAENGIINLLDRKTGKELVSLFALDEEDWAVVTPEGLFDASPNGRKLMHYIVGLEAVSLEQMKDAYYVPGLLQKIYKGEPLPRVKLFSKNDLFPKVEVQKPTDNDDELTVNLKDRGGGIGEVQVLVNGKELSNDAISSDAFNANSREANLKIDLSKAATFIAGEENKIEVIARNKAGSLSNRGTRDAGVLIIGKGNKNKDLPDIYAIIAGVSDYTGDNLDLQFAAKDAEDFARVFELGAISLLNDNKKVHIRLLTSNGEKSNVKFNSPDSFISTATKADFEKAFADFSKAKPNDVFIVYLAGHGISLNLNKDSNSFGGDKYLYLTQEATTTDKSVLAVENSRKAMTLSGDELKDLMKQNGALKQVLILDTCAAGAYSSSVAQKRDLPSDQIRALENLKDSTGFYVLMGSSADAVSYEASQYGQGLLTYSLLQAMKGAKLRENQFANVSLLFNYAQETVPEMARKIRGIQRPLVIAPNASGSFDIGRFTENERKEIKLSSPKPLILRPSLQNEKLRFDDLKLSQMLTKALREASFVSARGQETAPVIFIDADEMEEAIIPSGTYSIEGEELTFKIVLVQNNSVLGKEIVLRGKLNKKEDLINQLVEEITRAASIQN